MTFESTCFAVLGRSLEISEQKQETCAQKNNFDKKAMESCGKGMRLTVLPYVLLSENGVFLKFNTAGHAFAGFNKEMCQPKCSAREVTVCRTEPTS